MGRKSGRSDHSLLSIAITNSYHLKERNQINSSNMPSNAAEVWSDVTTEWEAILSRIDDLTARYFVDSEGCRLHLTDLYTSFRTSERLLLKVKTQFVETEDQLVTQGCSFGPILGLHTILGVKTEILNVYMNITKVIEGLKGVDIKPNPSVHYFNALLSSICVIRSDLKDTKQYLNADPLVLQQTTEKSSDEEVV